MSLRGHRNRKLDRAKKIIHVVHGINNPLSEKRSTDDLVKKLLNDGYYVVEHEYNWIDPMSQAAVAWELNKLSENDVVIGHSWGGILTDLFASKAKHIELSSIHSSIKGSEDWLKIEFDDPSIVQGSGHTLDNKIYSRLLETLRVL